MEILNHINQEKLDIYILNKDLLGNELTIVENHLSDCALCNKNYLELVKFYGDVKNASPVSITNSQIKKVLERHRNETEVRFETIFVHGKKNYLKSLKSLLTDISWGAIAPALKWSFAGAAAIILFALVYLNIFYPGPETAKRIIDQKIDTTSNQNKLPEIQQQEKLVQEEPKKEEEKQEEKKKQQKPFFAFLTIYTGSKGLEKDEYSCIKTIDNSKKSVVLFVYKSDQVDKKQDPGEIANSNVEKYRILFEKYPLLEAENDICGDIDLDNEKYSISVSAKGRCDDKYGKITYVFNNDFSLNDININRDFVTRFGSDIEGSDKEKSEKLKENLKPTIKYWNGKTYVNTHTALNP